MGDTRDARDPHDSLARVFFFLKNNWQTTGFGHTVKVSR